MKFKNISALSTLLLLCNGFIHPSALVRIRDMHPVAPMPVQHINQSEAKKMCHAIDKGTLDESNVLKDLINNSKGAEGINWFSATSLCTLAQEHLSYSSHKKIALDYLYNNIRNNKPFNEFKNLVEKVPWLLSSPNQFGCKVAHWATVFKNKKVFEYIKTLHPNLLAERDQDGRHAAHLAALYGNLEALKDIEKLYPDLLADQDHRGNNAAHLAEVHGSLEMITYLWKANSNLFTVKMALGAMPIHVASMYGHLDSVKYLCKENKLFLEREGKFDLMTGALATDQKEIVEFVLEAKDRCNIPEALLLSITCSSPQSFLLLLYHHLKLLNNPQAKAQELMASTIETIEGNTPFSEPVATLIASYHKPWIVQAIQQIGHLDHEKLLKKAQEQVDNAESATQKESALQIVEHLNEYKKQLGLE